MSLFTSTQLEAASSLVHQNMAATPQIQWPLICEALGTETWVKHENHTPIGAFKIRGGITYIDGLLKNRSGCQGIVTATRGNHGQSQARAASAAGINARIVVPRGNSTEKNAAMRAFGGEVIVHGDDFDAARAEAVRLSKAENLMLVPPFDDRIVLGVATYALELFTSIQDIDEVYVPVGCGSGICGLILTRDLLGLKTRIVGVVSTGADAAKKSFESGAIVQTATAQTFADGMAVRIPVEQAFDIYSKGADRMVAVSDEEVAEAMRMYFSFTHNVAEGAGAAPLAAAFKEQHKLKGKKIALILTGGNVDRDLFSKILAGQVPAL